MIRSEFDTHQTKVRRWPVGRSYPQRTHQLMRLVCQQTGLSEGVALYYIMDACLGGPDRVGTKTHQVAVKGMPWEPRGFDTNKDCRNRTLYWPGPMHELVDRCKEAGIRNSDLIESVTTSWFLWANRRPIPQYWALPTAYAYLERQRQRGLAMPDVGDYLAFRGQILKETNFRDFDNPWSLQVVTDPG